MKVEYGDGVLDAIYLECEKYDDEETGGRLIGVIDGDILRVLMQIGPGPNAKRTRTSFFQDGDYQEKVFRGMEAVNPKIEHLGNWHTHHPNGLHTLSRGDIETYRRAVNHKNHNHDYFLALLVTAKMGPKNYRTKDFLLKRGDSAVYEIRRV